MVAVLPRHHPLASARRVKLADLLDTPLILMNRDSSVRRIVDTACASLGRMPAPAYEPAYMATAIGMVRAGLGATLLPSSALEIAAAADLVMQTLEAMAFRFLLTAIPTVVLWKIAHRPRLPARSPLSQEATL